MKDDDVSQDCYRGDEMVTAIRHGQLSRGRWLAWQNLQESTSPLCEKEIRRLYVNEADDYLSNITLHELVWESSFAVANDEPRLVATIDEPDCCALGFSKDEDTVFQPELWDQCCSKFTQPKIISNDVDSNKCVRNDNDSTRRLCCDFYFGSSSYLYLPLLQELSLRLRVRTDQGNIMAYDLEQDGLLRHFDTAGVLWPTAYLLTLCVAGPRHCGISQLLDDAVATHPISSGPMVVELGTGIGIPAIVMTQTLQQLSNKKNKDIKQPSVVATDKSLPALALTLSNARAANVSSSHLTVGQLDFSNVTAVQEFRNLYGGFAVVLGSSLMFLFDPDKPELLLRVLDILLDERNPHAIAILAHTVDAVQLGADAGFRLVYRVPSSHFGMRSRHDDTSEFDISVYTRGLVTHLDEL